MKKIDLNEYAGGGSKKPDLPVIARKTGQAGIVFIDRKTGKPDPTSYMSAADVAKLSKQDQEKIGKYIDPDKFRAAEAAQKRNKERQAQIEAEKQRLKGVGNPPAPPAAPPAPAGRSTAPAAPSAPGRSTAPAPQASPVAKYMAAASAARKIQDPIQRAAEMEKVKQSGLDIWKSKYASTLAKNVNPDGTQKGTGQSLMAKQAQELRNTKISSSPESGTQVRSNLPGGNYSVPASDLMTQRTRNLLGTQPVRLSQGQPLAAQPETITPAAQSAFARSRQTAQAMGQAATARNLAGPTAAPTAVPNLNVTNPAKVALKKPVIKASYEYDSYDLVLEYLLSEGHADTVDEAHYVMLQMSSEHVQNIVEAKRVLAQRTINGVTVPGYVNVERKGGFLGFGGQNVPVGNFKPTKVSSKDAARYNQQIDTKYGTGSNKDAMPAYRVQQRALNQGSSGYMRIANPDEIPNTGAANRPTPQRAGDQNRALNLLRPDVPIKSTVPSTPENLRDPEFRRSGGWTGDPNAGRTAPKSAPKSKITMTDAEFDKKYSWAMNPPKPKSKPDPAPKSTADKPTVKPAAAPAPKPQPATIQSKNVTAGGVKYERRTPTSAEMAAAKQAGGGEAGVKAAVDVAKSNKVAATAPTPDMKPAEAPKKRESLRSQLDDLQKMRKAAEERNK